MGSPENYYGVFGQVRNATTTTTVQPPPDVDPGPNTGTGQRVATTRPGTDVWSTTSGSLVNAVNSSTDNVYARSSTNNQQQQWATFGLATTANPGSPIPNPDTSGSTTSTIDITGIVVTLDDTFLTATCANSKVGVELNWNAGAAGSWSTQIQTPVLGTSTTTGDYLLPATGGSGTTSAWGSHPWVRSDFTDANFRIRLTAIKGCGTASTFINVDQLRIQVFYVETTTTILPPVTTTNPWPDTTLYGPGVACLNGVPACARADAAGGGQTLNPRGFWATMNTQGAGNINGDAFQPNYDTGSTVAPNCPTATLRACYDPDNYYNYAVEMPPNSTGGYVYIFDPVFCETDVASGTGDRHFSGSDAVSSFYELYSTGTSLFTRADDTLLATSGNLFTGMAYQDTSMGGDNGSECRQKATAYGDARDYHDSWFLLNPSTPLTGGPGGTVYRVHTTGTNPSARTQQQGTDGEQSFAIYATDTAAGGVLPKVYGLGAMQMFTPLTAGSSTVNSSFYLAQIDPIHAGKTLELHLWDPGDTQSLIADLAVQIPTSSGWTSTPLSYSAKVGTSGSGTERRLQHECIRLHIVHPDVERWHSRRVQRLLAHDRHPDPDHLYRATAGLVEDPVHDAQLGDGDRHVERCHDLDSRDPGQSGPPRRSVIRAASGEGQALGTTAAVRGTAVMSASGAARACRGPRPRRSRRRPPRGRSRSRGLTKARPPRLTDSSVAWWSSRSRDATVSIDSPMYSSGRVIR